MSFQTLIRLQEEVPTLSTPSMPQNVNHVLRNKNPGPSTVVTSDPVGDSASGYEKLDLQILSCKSYIEDEL
jgi:hypothetical protein